MLVFVSRRLAFLGLTVLGMSVVLFVITRLIPADPARIADAYSFLYFMYHSTASKGSGRNFMYYSNPKVDDLIVRATAATARCGHFRQPPRTPWPRAIS